MATFSVQDAAERASVSERTVRRWIADGVLPAARGRHGRTVAADDLIQFLDAGRPTDNRDGQPADARTSAAATNGQRTSEDDQRTAGTSALAELLREAIERAERNAAAAAMWQARAELLQAQVEQASASNCVRCQRRPCL